MVDSKFKHNFQDFNPNLDPIEESDVVKYRLEYLYASVFSNNNFPNGECYGRLKDFLFFHRASYPLNRTREKGFSINRNMMIEDIWKKIL